MFVDFCGWMVLCVCVCMREGEGTEGARYDAVAMNLLSSREFLFYCPSRAKLRAGKL